MKVLILTVTAGEGHNSTADAIRAQMEAEGIECEVLDAALKISRSLYNFISKGYLLSTADFKSLYARVYGKLEQRKKNSFTPSVTRTTYGMVIRKIHEHILRMQPDVIVYTHIFAGVLLDVIAEKKGLSARTVGILTDFAMHPFWEESLRTDRVVIPNEMLLPAARRKGLTDGQIAPIGIPIRPQFAEKNAVPQAEARRRLGLLPDLPTVLLMGGSMGYGNLAGTLRELDDSPTAMQIISVCGNNAKAKEEIDALTFKKPVHNFGYTNEIALMMDAADCIVTKPGGLTTSEALAKRLPIIICNPIPGQEDRNTDFLLNMGAAMRVSRTVRLSDVLYQLFHDPARVALMKESIDLIRKPNATADLIALVRSLGAAARCAQEKADGIGEKAAEEDPTGAPAAVPPFSPEREKEEPSPLRATEQKRILPADPGAATPLDNRTSDAEN